MVGLHHILSSPTVLQNAPTGEGFNLIATMVLMGVAFRAIPIATMVLMGVALVQSP